VAGSEFVAEVEIRIALAPAEGRAVLGLEARGAHRLKHAGFLNEVQAVRKQAFADGKARKALALDDQYIVTLALEQRAGDGAGRPGADDHDFTVLQLKRRHRASLHVVVDLARWWPRGPGRN